MAEDLQIPEELLAELEKEGILDEIMDDEAESQPEEKVQKKAQKPTKPVKPKNKGGRPRLSDEEKARRKAEREAKGKKAKQVEVKINLEDLHDQVRKEAAGYFKSEMERRLTAAKVKGKPEPEAKTEASPATAAKPAPPAQPVQLPPQPLPLQRTVTAAAPAKIKRFGMRN